jgi:hypothetical protein
MPDRGEPISYLVLAEGTPVYTSDGEQIGEVGRVLAVPDDDIFDGLIVDTPHGDRFVDSEHVGELYERAATLELSTDQARHLHDPAANPATMEVHPDDTVEHSELRETLRKAWDRISGNY